MELEKQDNTVKLDNNYSQANLNIFLKITNTSSAYLVNIPAFNIHFYVKDKQEIEKSTLESMESFFNFWIHKRPAGEFMQHMSALGFNLKSETFQKVAEPSAHYSSTTRVSIDRIIFS